MNSNKLTGKDLISIGIYSAIYFIINFIFMIMGIIPIMWILMPAMIALFTGIPYMLLCAKVQKPGAILIMGSITALIYFVTGQFTPVILITFGSGCIIGEIIRIVTKYNSFKGNTFSFMFFSLGMIGSPLPVWLFKESFFAQIQSQGMPADYINTLSGFASTEMLVVMIVATVVFSFVGILIAKAIFKKHFEKAGII
ncbi:MptD family putative ECF transporter S component [Clostridium sp. MSJ-11]|uniref:MptD family putative ECF transporter S component n=1 Tax=Clostridium mobile TaxID=2841512 RepID=A0ABS6ELC4_9CLOT|nr:MptD family putative ECF transporter S component [Clostridium mobile]MBU5486017.1 MptD family putative ECF transporter S component [Clostridium mobile]